MFYVERILICLGANSLSQSKEKDTSRFNAISLQNPFTSFPPFSHPESCISSKIVVTRSTACKRSNQ